MGHQAESQGPIPRSGGWGFEVQLVEEPSFLEINLAYKSRGFYGMKATNVSRVSHLSATMDRLSLLQFGVISHHVLTIIFWKKEN